MISSGNISAPHPAVDFSRWGDVEVQKLSKIQRITGQRLQQAWQTIPHVTQFDQANITELEQHRKKLKKKLTFSDRDRILQIYHRIFPISSIRSQRHPKLHHGPGRQGLEKMVHWLEPASFRRLSV